MKKSVNKMMQKMEHQNRVNPGHKEKYEPPLRPRSTVFKTGTDFDRRKTNEETREILDDYWNSEGDDNDDQYSE